MEQNHEALMDRLKKLLEMSKSSNPNEASIALKRAQKLMKEHQLSLEDVSMSEIQEKSEEIPSALRDRALFTRLAAIVGNAFGVHYFFVGVSSVYKTVTFIGPKSRLETACYTYTILARQAVLVKKQYAADERKRLTQEMGGTARLSQEEKEFYSHVSYFINLGIFDQRFLPPYTRDEYERISRLMNAGKSIQSAVRANTKAYMEGWLIAVLQKVNDFAMDDEEERLIENFTEKYHPDLTSFRKRKRYFNNDQMDAYHHGKSDGANGFNLYHGVNGTAAARLGFKD